MTATNKMCRNLYILVWKHLMVRKRKFISTIFELISPISLILLMFMIKDLLTSTSQAEKTMGVTTAEMDPFELPRSVIPERIYYTPDTLLVGDLMDAVGNKLLRSRMDSLPDLRTKGFYALPSDTDIENLLSEITNRDAIVIFQDMSLAATWPKKLNYTIRMNMDFMTHIYNSLDEIIEPHDQFGAIYEPFMALQLAIDTSYIKMLTNMDVNQTVMFQDFPYTTSMEGATIVIICALLAIFCSLSLLLPFVFLMSHLLAERATGQEELVKMAGVSTNTLGISHFLNALPAGLIYTIVTTILLKVPQGTPLVPHTDPILIFLMLFLHFVSIISAAFACSYITQSSEYSTSVAVFVYSALWFPSSWLSGRVKSKPLVLLTGLLPHVPNNWFWSQVAAADHAGKGVQFSSLARNFNSTYGSPLMCYLFFILQSIIFFSLSWYLSKVRPGKYGHAKSWNFLCNKRKVKPDLESGDDAREQMVQDSMYFEPPPKHLNAGIKIINVTKVYPKNRVLNNLSLEIYKGEITVLLGHNGAGKTTLMSIITGMKSATEGVVYVNGEDSRSARAALKQQIGYCPQENLFFTDLTVLEHVMFFAMLKGATFSEARDSSFDLLAELGIRDKARNMGHSLSGGMKRRLQLACALAGGSSVLILDEPTSGLDVETRRDLWNLLLCLRGDRTVVVSTHFMEEADALGDRIAALQAGALVCHATPMHLKKALDTGYRLSFTTVASPRIADISGVVTSHVPGASVTGQTFSSVTYSLPAKSSDKFPALFGELETNRSHLGIDSIGVGVSTLEEVFLKLCSDKRTPIPQDEVDGVQVPEPTYMKETGPRLYFRQFLVLIRRQIKFIWSKKILFLTLNVFLPILLILSFTRMSSDGDNKGDPKNVPKAMSLDLYNDMPEKRAFYFDNSSGVGMRAVRERYPDVQFEYTNDVAKAVLETAAKDKIEYNKYLVGIELSDSKAKVLYTTTVRHAAAVALNLLTNMLAANYIPGSDGRVITTYNHPHQRVTTTTLIEPKSTMTAVFWALLVSFIIQNVLLSHIALPSKERISGARHIHMMSGCPATLHWVTTLLFHATFSVVTLAVPTVIIAAVADPDRTLGDPGALGAIFITITLGCMAVLSFIYLCSFKLSEKGADSAVLFIIGFVFSIFTASIALGSDMFSDTNESIEMKLAKPCKYIFPQHAFTEALARTVLVARLNAYCTLNKEKCPDLVIPVKGVDSEHCCATGSGNSCYFCMDDMAPGKEILILFIHVIVYMCIVILTQRGFFGSVWNRLISRRYSPDKLHCNDPLVRDEKAYVDNAIELPDKQITDAMLAHDLHKRYVGIFKKTCNAVKGVSFSVKKGECFGLLGVNGAGKSTTFKMLVCEESPTRGRLFANGYRRDTNKWQYMHSLGYCPQFFGMDNFQTGKENLTMLLTLRGFSASHVSSEVQAWIQVVGLEQYANRAVSAYSGGCVRRLGTAAALCVGAPVTLLDEPTSGVDVAARRNVWAALRRGLRQRRAVVITSHSMDEMEALCNRIAIMSKGETCALGSPAALRAAYATGHALILKLASRDETDSSMSELDRLKGELHKKFYGKLDREHKTMLHYHISEAMSYSELFTRLEQLKSTYPSLIEDYAITETTLEEVFLSFAKDGAVTDPPDSPVAQSNLKHSKHPECSCYR